MVVDRNRRSFPADGRINNRSSSLCCDWQRERERGVGLMDFRLKLIDLGDVMNYGNATEGLKLNLRVAHVCSCLEAWGGCM
ncbi:hypothetical protein HanIR_Chr04g0187851 [Helianthus annuus]|nr:hypothetical protein HanIR_Chr04g0187851 [Helianthus annuus]